MQQGTDKTKQVLSIINQCEKQPKFTQTSTALDFILLEHIHVYLETPVFDGAGVIRKIFIQIRQSALDGC